MAMFNPVILNTEVQTYLRENLSVDVRKISLQKSPFDGIKSSELAEQIKGLKIAKSKFPFFYHSKEIYYPPSLNLEQASSQYTAEYKSQLIHGKTLIDLTAGLGIDSYHFAQKFQEVTALEKDAELVEICKHNYKSLHQKNLEYLATSFERYLKENSEKKWDVIYLDPARRKNAQKKFLLEDLEPNLLDWIEIFFNHSETLMVKLSPLMDLQRISEQIPFIHEIHIVAVKNEVKELLVICRNEKNFNPKVFANNLESIHTELSFYLKDEKEIKLEFSKIKKYIYEPNAALLKTGAFKFIASKYNLEKLDVNTHLYTSNELNTSFPGKIYTIKEELKEFKKSIRNQSFHVISKNYPLSVENIRKKYKLKESAEPTLLCTKDIEGYKHLICERIF